MGRETLVKSLKEEIPDINGKKIYIWGTGDSALLCYKGIKRLEEESFLDISGYCDNNEKKWGTFFCGKQVISPKELFKMKNVFVLICSQQPRVYREIKEQLNMGG